MARIWDLTWKLNKIPIQYRVKFTFFRLGLFFARAWNDNSLTRPLIPNCGANETFRRPNNRRVADMISASLYNSRFDFELRIARPPGSHFAFGVTYYLSNKWVVESRRIHLWRHCDTKFHFARCSPSNHVRTTREGLHFHRYTTKRWLRENTTFRSAQVERNLMFWLCAVFWRSWPQKPDLTDEFKGQGFFFDLLLEFTLVRPQFFLSCDQKHEPRRIKKRFNDDYNPPI